MMDKIIIIGIVSTSISSIYYFISSFAYKIGKKETELKDLKERNKELENRAFYKDQSLLKNNSQEKDFRNILNERYATGEINEEEYSKIMDVISNKNVNGK